MSDPSDVPIEHQLVVRTLIGQAFGGAGANRLASLCREMFFPKGTVIYRAGDAAKYLYFIVEGRVELSVDGGESWAFTNRGLFGILDAELERPHARTATALTDARVIALRSEDWQDLVEDTFELSRRRLDRNAANLVERGLLLSPHGGFEGVPEVHRESEQVPGSATPSDAEPFPRLLVLYLTDVFERAGMQSLIRLARAANDIDASVGDIIVRRGESATSLMVVASGRVAIEREEPYLRANFGAGRLVGGYAGLGQRQWPVTVRALEDTRIFAIDWEDVFDVMEDHFDLVRSVFAFLAVERDRVQTFQW